MLDFSRYNIKKIQIADLQNHLRSLDLDDWETAYDFLLVFCCNYVFNLYHLQDITSCLWNRVYVTKYDLQQSFHMFSSNAVREGMN